MGFKLAPSLHPLGDTVLPIFGAGSDLVETIVALPCVVVLHHFIFKMMSSYDSGSDVALDWPERIMFMLTALVFAICFASFAYRRPRKDLFWSMTWGNLIGCVVNVVYSPRKYPWLGLYSEVLMETSSSMVVTMIVPSAETLRRWRRKSEDSKEVEDKEKPDGKKELESKKHIT